MSLMVRVHDSMHQGLEGVLTLITIIPSVPLVGTGSQWVNASTKDAVKAPLNLTL